ncbi:hypothetical protein C446_06740 [Halobiforma nitratireducens JCM 10879]|uniref:Uncharacterized protein n=1 Tax=Halobiforma nitratireducens JCM 10879 TaxID=1227454 RepID=M0M622_9EURY|nr:hypothetical protein C446_06740 [Halobiforma nitratireducens JCM 10879]
MVGVPVALLGPLGPGLLPGRRLALAVAGCLTLGVVRQANAALDATPLTEPRANSDTVTDAGADSGDFEMPVETLRRRYPVGELEDDDFNVVSRASSGANTPWNRTGSSPNGLSRSSDWSIEPSRLVRL